MKRQRTDKGKDQHPDSKTQPQPQPHKYDYGRGRDWKPVSQQDMYQPLQTETEDLAESGVDMDEKIDGEYVPSFLRKLVTEGIREREGLDMDMEVKTAQRVASMAVNLLKKKMTSQSVALDNPVPDSAVTGSGSSAVNASERHEFERKHASRFKLGAKKRKKEEEEDDGDGELEKIDFKSLIPLHNLWKGYMGGLIKELNLKGTSMMDMFLKADYHGALITVVRSLDPQLIGLRGLLLLEKEKEFKIVLSNGRVRRVPKMHNIFTVKVLDQLLTIHGNQFCFRSYDRAARKFKTKNTIEL